MYISRPTSSLSILRRQLILLRGMRELLSTKERWIKGSYAVDGLWLCCPPTDPSAVAWCLEGAAKKVIEDQNLELRVPFMNTFNDDQKTKYEDVIASIDREIRKLDLRIMLLEIGSTEKNETTEES